MKSMMRRTTIREIKQSLGRYLAILAIVALGVGFFAGLRVTRPAMLETGNTYFNQNKFYDFRLLSTLGFDEEDLAQIKTAEGVSAVEGAVSVDFFAGTEDKSELVLRAHSLTTEINNLILKEGTMPRNIDECVVDAAIFGVEVGDTIHVSETNLEETREQFVKQEYKVVGKVQSPLYINFERGNTTLGSGKISAFAYFPKEAFDLDYYTEVYVNYQHDFKIYSEEYDTFVEQKEIEMKELCEGRADIRYEKVYQEADDLIKEGEQELADAKKKLADAKEELADAKVKLEDGKKEIQTNEKKLLDAEQELKEGELDLAEGEQKVADGEQELTDGWEEYREGEKELADNRILLGEAGAQVQRGRLLYEENLVVWKDGMKQLNDAKQKLDESKKTLDNGWSQYNLLLSLNTVTGFTEAKMKLANLTEAEKQEYSLLFNIVSSIEAELNKNGIPSTDDIQLKTIVDSILTGMKDTLTAINVSLTAGQAEYDKGLLQYEEAKKPMEEAKAKLDFALTQVVKGETELADATKKIVDAQQQLDDAKAELEKGELELADARLEVADGKQELEDGKKEIADAKKKLEEGKIELADGEKEYEDGKKEYEEAKAEADTEIADAEDTIQDAKADLSELEIPEYYVLGRNTNIGYVCFENDSDIVEGISAIFPIFFFLVAALVCITTMNRMVEEQRTQIGILKALGYSKATIMGKYMFYAGSAAVIGCVAGFIAGSYVFPLTIWQAYGMMYDFSRTIEYIFDPQLFLIAILVSLLCSMGTTYLSCRHELSTVASELIRPKSPKNGKRILLERIPFFWNHLNFLYKVSIRNVVRYKKRFFMMILGISGCSALLVTGFGVKDSVSDIVAQQYGNIQKYDVNITFKEPPTQEEKEEFLGQVEKNLPETIFSLEESVDIVQGNKIKTTTLVVPETTDTIEEFINLVTSKGEKIAYPKEGEIVLTEKMAQKENIEKGDTITIRNSDNQEMNLLVSGLTENFVYHYAYISQESYRNGFEKEPEYKTAYSKMKEGKDYNQVTASLLDMDNVASAAANEMIKERFGNMIMSLNSVVLLVIVSAGALAFIVLYNLTNINITERIREIATIKVLGFYPLETAAYVFRENFVLTGIGGVAGLALGVLLHRFVMMNITIDAVSFDIKILPISFIYSISLTFIFAILVNVMMYFKLQRINMAESLKSIE